MNDQIRENVEKMLTVFNRNSNQSVEDEETLAERLKAKGTQCLTLEEAVRNGKFMEDSFVLSTEDDPNDFCYYTPNGTNLIPIYMGSEIGEQLTKEGAKEHDVYDAESFISLFKDDDEALVVCIKL